jgi:hypothetical protein
MALENLNNTYDGETEGDGNIIIPNKAGSPPEPSTSGDHVIVPNQIKQPEPGSFADLGVATRGTPYGENLDVLQYYNPTGHYSPGQGDINLLAGQYQSAWAKARNWVPRVVGKAATGILEGVGYVPMLLGFGNDDGDYSNGLTQAMQDANKWMDEAMPIYRTSKGSDTFGEQGWALNDLGGWLNGAEGIASSIASFAAMGAGAAKIVGLVGKLGAMAEGLGAVGRGVAAFGEGMQGLNTVRTAGMIGSQVGKTMVAGTLAYTEGAMSGKRVYDTVLESRYNELIAGGEKDLDKAMALAKDDAAHAAQTAVRINTVVNTGLNLFSGVSQFFNYDKHLVQQVAEKNLFEGLEKGSKEWIEKMALKDGNKYAAELMKGRNVFTKAGLKHSVKEAVGEGIEEMVNQYAEQTGIEQGKKGQRLSNWEQSVELISKFADRTFNQEGAMNFILGAVGGIGGGLVTERLLRTEKIETGGYKQNEAGELLDKNNQIVKDVKDAVKLTKRVSPYAAGLHKGIRYFNNIKEKLMEEGKDMIKLEDEMKEALLKGDPMLHRQLTDEYNDLVMRNSVRMGFAANMKATYQSIADMDNTRTERDEVLERIDNLQKEKAGLDPSAHADEITELDKQIEAERTTLESVTDKTAAQLLGWTDSKDNNEFQQKAIKAMDKLDYYQALHDKLEKKYDRGYEANDDETHLFHHIFEKHAMLYDMKGRKAELEGEVAEMEANDSLSDHDKIVTRQYKIGKLARQHNRIAQEMNDLHEHLNNPSEDSAGAKVLRKYGANNVAGESIQEIKATLDHLEKKRKEKSDAYDNALNEEIDSEDFERWKEEPANRTATIEDYRKHVVKNYKTNMLRENKVDAIEDLGNRISLYKRHIQDLESAPTMNRIQRNVANYHKKLAETMRNERLTQLKRNNLRDINTGLLQKSKQKAINRLRRRLIKEFKERNKKVKKATNRLAKALQKYDELEQKPKEKVETFSKRKAALLHKINVLRIEALALKEARDRILESLYTDAEVEGKEFSTDEELIKYFEKLDVLERQKEALLEGNNEAYLEATYMINHQLLLDLGVQPYKEYTIDEVLELVNQQGGTISPDAKRVLRKIVDKAKELGITVSFDPTFDTTDGEAYFSTNGNKVTMSVDTLMGDDENLGHILVHELVHSVTTVVIYKHQGEDSELGRQIDLLKEWLDIVKAREETNSNSYGFTNIQELLAEFTNPNFYKYFTIVEGSNIFKRFINFVANALEISDASAINNIQKILMEANDADSENYIPSHKSKTKLEKVQDIEAKIQKLKEQHLLKTAGVAPPKDRPATIIADEALAKAEKAVKDYEDAVEAAEKAKKEAEEAAIVAEMMRKKAEEASAKTKAAKEKASSLLARLKGIVNSTGRKTKEEVEEEKAKEKAEEAEAIQKKAEEEAKQKAEEAEKKRKEAESAKKEAEDLKAEKEKAEKEAEEAKEAEEKKKASEVESTTPANDVFTKFVTSKGYNLDVILAIGDVIHKITNERMEWSLDALNGILPPMEGAQVMTEMKPALAETAEILRKSMEILNENEQEDFGELGEDFESDGEGIPVEELFGESETLLEDNTEIKFNEAETIEQTDAIFTNIKVVEAAHGIAKKQIRSEKITTGLNFAHKAIPEIEPGINLDTLDPTKLQAGTVIVFSVDTAYDGMVSLDPDATKYDGTPYQVESKFSDYTDSNGNITDVENVPIKVTTEDGKLIGYVHRGKWISATKKGMSGPESHENVADVVDEIPGNVAIQTALNLENRKMIVQAHIDGVKISSTIEEVNKGKPFITPWNKSSENLRGVVRDGTNETNWIDIVVFDSSGMPKGSAKHTVASETLQNRLCVMLPTQNGSHVPFSLKSEPMGADIQNQINLVRIFELVALIQDPTLSDEGREGEKDKVTTELKAIKDMTSYDLAVQKEFEAFITQYYTHMSSTLKAKSEEFSGKSFLTVHSDKNGVWYPVIHTTGKMTGLKKVDMRPDTTGELSKDMKTALKDLLDSRHRTVSLPGKSNRHINENQKEPFNVVSYKGNKWVTKAYKDYNDFIMQNTQVRAKFIKGSSTIDHVMFEDGKKSYVYYTNANRQFAPISYTPIKVETLLEDTSGSTTLTHSIIAEPTVQEKPTQEEQTMNPFEDSEDYSRTSVGIISNGVEINESSLTKLLNEVPLSVRNSNTVESLKLHYASLNITHLAENDNPFKQCK